jgi:hypothetical protein
MAMGQLCCLARLQKKACCLLPAAHCLFRLLLKNAFFVNSIAKKLERGFV